MGRWVRTSILLVASLGLVSCSAAGGAPGTGASAPSTSPAPRGLVWSAEFDEPAGTPLDPSQWSISDRGDGYGNNELQAYTDRPENVWIDGSGALHLIAVEEPYTDPQGAVHQYTSGRIETRTRFEHGRVEARIRVPAGAGLWSAFWLFGESLNGEDWPAVGEIDAMESLGGTDELHTSAIGATQSGERWSLETTTVAATPFSDDWHVYAVEWDQDAIDFLVDGHQIFRAARDELTEGQVWPFDRPYSVTLNLAVGGDWPGSPKPETVFPAEFVVDWVRVYDSEVSPPS